MHIATGVHIRLCSSNTVFNPVSDCSVQCMNRAIKPPATVTRAVTPTTMTENVIDILLMMLLPLHCRAGIN